MDNTEAKSAAVSGAELKIGLRDMFIFFGIAAVLLLLGLVFVGNAGGPVKNRMTLLGLISLMAAPCMLIVGVGMLFRRIFAKTRAKTPEKAFELFWNAVFENKTFSYGYEDAEIAVNKITRSLPAAVRQTLDHTKTTLWISHLHNITAESNGELAEECGKVCREKLLGAKGKDDVMNIENISVETADEHKAVVSADLYVVRSWSRSVQGRNETDRFVYRMSAGVLHPKTTLLKAGKYRYVPDWMPKAEKGERISALKESEQ